MRTILDGAAIEIDRPTVACAIASAAAVAQERGRIVVEVEVDGQPLSGPQLETPSDAEGEASEVKLTSAEPRHLVGVTLAEAADAVGVSGATHTHAATLLQEGNEGKAAEAIGEVLSIWNAARSAFDHGAALLGEDLLGQLERSKNAAEELAVHLEALRAGVQLNDWSAVADTLEHDLGPQTRVWSGLLREASERVLATAGDGGGTSS